MSQEDKNLLFKDLCSRLPYGVKMRNTGICGTTNEGTLWCIEQYDDPIIHLDEFDLGYIIGKDDIKPYLRRMSSMTEAEKDDFSKFFVINDELVIASDYTDYIDWLNSHYFDYRGLIDKGLAIEVTEENNPYVLY